MTPKIIFYTRLASQVGRNRLQGIFDYLSDNQRNWDLRLPQTCNQFFAEIKDGAPHGMIIASHQEQQVFRWAERSDVPTVFIDIYGEERTRKRPVDITIRNDDGGFGLMAAKYFRQIGGFASYGYVPSSVSTLWCQRRQRGFAFGLKGAAGPFCRFDGNFDGDFPRWILALEKPTALYVAYDELARKVINVCQSLGLVIGRQVAVLGTDNDEIVCTLTRPEISSIEPDSGGEGYLAAQNLDLLLSAPKKARSRTVLCKARRIVARSSTKPPPPGQALVQAILDYIRREYAAPITPESIARHFNCSRRLLDIRLTEAIKMTLSEKLNEVRLNQVRTQLRKSSQSIDHIAEECGFANPNSLKNLFKRTYGISMREYRKTRQSVSSPNGVRGP